ncbi:sporulation integral membrane protein YtvI [Striga asiatica]|uniref:Sporulation integral membrane protein YtvI n=1 Tax=Striga asiatica TaxID=4170 RepID=A0A5A7QT04_STRAF|nr:sporulation integral membrane protein YtvI [Striga asiatica]
MRAERIAAGLQSGWAAFSRAARPLTCGHDMDVPVIMLNWTLRLSIPTNEGPNAGPHPARMFTPGAMRSGFRISGVIGLGPLELKAGTIGEGFTPTVSFPLNIILALALDLWDCKYLFISRPAFLPTLVPGDIVHETTGQWLAAAVE